VVRVETRYARHRAIPGRSDAADSLIRETRHVRATAPAVGTAEIVWVSVAAPANGTARSEPSVSPGHVTAQPPLTGRVRTTPRPQAAGRRPVPVAPAVGVVVQLVLLAALAATTGLGLLGWLAGVTYGAVLGITLTRGLRRSGSTRLGPADHVTLARATLIGCVTALVADTVHTPPPLPLLATIAAVALALDAVDGQVARRTGTVSPLGARFDMEADAFLILVLSVLVAESLGVWVLAIGAMRYAFVAASLPLRWLRSSLPTSIARKAVAALQGIALLVVAADVLPYVAGVVVAALALTALTWSFGRDVVWLFRTRDWRARRRATVVRPDPITVR
jgi:phosphatidylglycerophosphate synthase